MPIPTPRQDPGADAGRNLLEGVQVEVRNVVEVMQAYKVNSLVVCVSVCWFDPLDRAVGFVM